MIARFFGAVLLLAISASPALAQVASSKGMATINYSGGKAKPQDRQTAHQKAKLNAVERYIAEHNRDKVRLFDQARARILASIDDILLGESVLSETDDPAAKSYTIVLKADINTGRLDNALADSSGMTSARAEASSIAVVFVSRSMSSLKSFNDRVVTRVDSDVSATASSESARTTRESEAVKATSVSTGDSAKESASTRQFASAMVTTGGSTTSKADEIAWQVSDTSDLDGVISGTLSNAGLQVYQADFIPGMDLQAVRDDFSRGDKLSPKTLMALVAAVKAQQIPYVAIGTTTADKSDKDPASGSTRVMLKVNTTLYDLTGNLPRVLAALPPVQYAGLGTSDGSAQTNAVNKAASEVANQLVDQLAVKGVR